MKKLLATALLFLVSAVVWGQAVVVKHKNSPIIPMTLDGTIHGEQSNGSSAGLTAAVDIGTPTAGDSIVCEFSFSHSSTFTKVADNVNSGNYTVGAPVTLITASAYQGIYFKSNVAASDTTITLTYTTSTSYAFIACQAFKPNSPGNLHLDSTMVQQQNGTTANPTTGSALTPANNNELVIGLNTRYHTSATAGTNFTLIDSSTNAYYISFPEYWIQTTATSTNAPFTAAAEATWGDQQAAFYFQ